MEPKTLREIAGIVEGRLVGSAETLVSRVSTDTRTLRSGDLFFALRGDQFDGHDFVGIAAEQGAAAVCVETPVPGNDAITQILVPNTLTALQQLAAHNRRALSGLIVIGVTGSNGKTSTKEMLAAILRQKFQVLKTSGNLNNHIGVPLTMLRADSSYDLAIVECGISHPGEMAELAKIIQPTHAVITSIGAAHIEFFGSKKAIAEEKAVLAEAVSRAGTVFLPGNDEFSRTIAERCSAEVLLIGGDRGVVRSRLIEASANSSTFDLEYRDESARVRLPVAGDHMIRNALLAAAVGLHLGLTLRACAAGLAETVLPGGRLRFERIGEISVINDAYNANPDSVIAALETAARLPATRRIAALGAMAELGAETLAGHRKVGTAVADCGFDYLIAVGESALPMVQAAAAAGLAQTDSVADPNAAADRLSHYLEPGDLLLVKGSRSARMERLIQNLEATQKLGGWQAR